MADINNLDTTIIRIIAILFVSVLFVYFGIYATWVLDEYGFHDIFISNKDSENLSVNRLIFQIAIIVGIISIFSYIGKNLIMFVPFPLNNYCGFNYEQIREVTSGSLLTIFMIKFSATLSNKLTILQDKLDIAKTHNKLNENAKKYVV